MNNGVLYDLYTSDYSAATVRKTPVTKTALIREGIGAESAAQYFELYERLYDLFLNDAITTGIVSEETLSVWSKLLRLCENSDLVLFADYFHRDMLLRFPFRCEDILLRHGKLRVPRDSEMFRLCVEQKLSGVNLKERLLAYEYDLTFVAQNSDVEHIHIVRANEKNSDFDEVPLTEIKKLIPKIKLRRSKLEELLDPKQISAELATAEGAEDSVRSILERTCSLYDEMTVLEDLEDRLQGILDQPPVYTLSLQDILHVIMTEDTCTRNDHSVFDIKVAMTFDNGTTRHFTIQRCADCKQYRIGYPAFQKIWEEYGIPKTFIQYIGLQEDSFTGCWKDSSVFSQYGYSANLADGLSTTQRQERLAWIIKHGYCSKQETIAYLKSRITFNGKKPENWLALKKWQEDLVYVINLKL